MAPEDVSCGQAGTALAAFMQVVDADAHTWPGSSGLLAEVTMWHIPLLEETYEGWLCRSSSEAGSGPSWHTQWGPAQPQALTQALNA